MILVIPLKIDSLIILLVITQPLDSHILRPPAGLQDLLVFLISAF